MTARKAVSENDKPRFAPHVRFTFDRRRERWVVLAPERMLIPDEISVEILQRCTGEASLAGIIDALSGEFDASRDEIAGDVLALVQDMTDKGVLAS
ncbi:MAG: pyrroloquinoline quinone biosynthesis peptide chaperone PqqD [Rhodospirillales bacterium]|nr:pyrroloquinoline quinone biosynthesis peptide chaperone PqqD [Rhodospirillales bacterium]